MKVEGDGVPFRWTRLDSARGVLVVRVVVEVGFDYGIVCQYMSSVDGCIVEKFFILVVQGSSLGSLVKHHYGCLQECLLLYIVRTIWQEIYDI